MESYFVYIMANKTKTLYVGYTNNLSRRVYEHKNKLVQGFTSKYQVNKLVYFEELKNKVEAEAREKQLKDWHRDWKIKLIEKMNKNWKDLTIEYDILPEELLKPLNTIKQLRKSDPE